MGRLKVKSSGQAARSQLPELTRRRCGSDATTGSSGASRLASAGAGGFACVEASSEGGCSGGIREAKGPSGPGPASCPGFALRSHARLRFIKNTNVTKIDRRMPVSPARLGRVCENDQCNLRTRERPAPSKRRKPPLFQAMTSAGAAVGQGGELRFVAFGRRYTECRVGDRRVKSPEQRLSRFWRAQYADAPPAKPQRRHERATQNRPAG